MATAALTCVKLDLAHPTPRRRNFLSFHSSWSFFGLSSNSVLWIDAEEGGSKVGNTKLTHCHEITFSSLSTSPPHIHRSTSMYSSSPSFATLSLNFAPDETSPSTFLVKTTVSQNDVVISPVLFLAIIMTATTSEIKAIPKAVCK